MLSLARIALVAAVAIAAAGGCSKEDPNFCPDAPFHNCLNLLCESDGDCSTEAPVCDVSGTKKCVQCIAPSNVAACTGTTPVCSAEHTCQACSAHADCSSSDACLPDGSCGNDNNVAYVDPDGVDSAQCTKAAPCKTVMAALATPMPFVKLHGTADEGVTVERGRIVTLLADPGAKLTRGAGGAIVTVKDDSTSLSIFDLTISDAPNNPSGFGVLVPTGGGAPEVSISRATITNNPGGGISVSGGTLTVTRSTVSGNQGGGISMLANGVVSITNNFIHHNGNNLTSTFGGLSLKPVGASKVEFNTIVDNQANTGAASVGGVFCDQAGFIAAGNIIFRNTGGATGMVQTFGNCSYGNSINAPGASPVDNSLSFINPNDLPFDYHLTATSPSSVVDAAGACTQIDFDGDQRPLGSACDLGADELAK